MSFLNVVKARFGLNPTATENFVIESTGAGTGRIRKGDLSTVGSDVLTWDANNIVAMPNGSKNLTLMTAQATTSGTSIDFTGIPSWVKRITVMLNGVSTSGTSNLTLLIGAGSIDNASTYTYTYTLLVNAGATSIGLGTSTMFPIAVQQNIATIEDGVIFLTAMGNNKWSLSGNVGATSATAIATLSTGTKSLSGALDRIRLTTSNGTDTFDAGSVNVMYEG